MHVELEWIGAIKQSQDGKPNHSLTSAQLSVHNIEEEQSSIQHLFQRLSVALMKGNAALFNNRVPDSGAAGEDL